MDIDYASLPPLHERMARLPSPLTADEYHQAVFDGVLLEDDPLELIEGRLVVRQPIGSYHAASVGRLTRLLVRAVGDSALVWVSNPVRLSSRSEPQPDLMLLRPRDDDYFRALPSPAETLLLVEVSDSTLRFDRTVKVPLYARDGIPEVWLVDLEHRQLIVYTGPAEQGYRIERALESGEVAATLLPQARLRVEELFR